MPKRLEFVPMKLKILPQNNGCLANFPTNLIRCYLHRLVGIWSSMTLRTLSIRHSIPIAKDVHKATKTEIGKFCYKNLQNQFKIAFSDVHFTVFLVLFFSFIRKIFSFE